MKIMSNELYQGDSANGLEPNEASKSTDSSSQSGFGSKNIGYIASVCLLWYVTFAA